MRCQGTHCHYMETRVPVLSLSCTKEHRPASIKSCQVAPLASTPSMVKMLIG